MRRTVILALAATLLVGAWPAWAQPGQGPQGRRGMDRPMPQRQMPPADRGGQGQPGNAQGGPHRGQLTPEERRQLRRDISDHGRDIYRDPRGAPPPRQP